MKTLSIVIPVYNEKKDFLNLLHKVEGSSIGEIKKEIIIIDDYSTDGTRELLQDLDKTICSLLPAMFFYFFSGFLSHGFCGVLSARQSKPANASRGRWGLNPLWMTLGLRKDSRGQNRLKSRSKRFNSKKKLKWL